MTDTQSLAGWWNYQTTTATIANGAADSDAQDLIRGSLVGIITPAVLTNATMRFKVSVDNSNFYLLYDNTNTLVSLTVALGAAQAYFVDPTKFLGWRYVKLSMSGNEGAQRLFSVVARPI